MTENTEAIKVLKEPISWQDMEAYKLANTLYQLTYRFCQRFLPRYGDRTVDQMVQAARSCKQNIVEGSESAATSTEMEIKLINVARASICELREDYHDHLATRQLPLWDESHSGYAVLMAYIEQHSQPEHYLPNSDKWNEEEFCNTAYHLSNRVEALLSQHLAMLAADFIQHGGIRERMYSARTGYRQGMDAELKRLRGEVLRLQDENAALRADNAALCNAIRFMTDGYNTIRDCVESTYTDQKATIAALRRRLASHAPAPAKPKKK